MSATYAMNQTMSQTVRVVRVQTSAEKKKKNGNYARYPSRDQNLYGTPQNRDF
jgi:hypothetical protein